MTENLKIENFGPIKNVDLDLKRVFVLIGPQSSGKSVIAKLISIFRDWEFVVDRVSFVDLLKKHNVDSYIKEGSAIIYTSDAFTFTYKAEEAHTYGGEESLIYNESHEFYELLDKYRLFDITPKQILLDYQNETDQLVNYINESIALFKQIDNNAQIIEGFKQILSRAESFKTSLLDKEIVISNARQKILNFINFSEYVPAERILIPVISNSTLSFNKLDIPIPKNLIDFGAAFEKAREALGEIDISFLNIKYRFSNNENRVYLEDEQSILLNRASSGFQAIIPMLLVITHLSPNSEAGHTFVIEEPEQNLFPETQSHLVKFLTEHCTKEDKRSGNFNELVITTHSPYILTSFNNLLLAHKVSAIDDLREEVENIVSKQFWINPDNFNAYFIEGGRAKQIFDEQLGLIAENELDSASEYIMDEFNQLMELRRSKRYAK